MCTKIEIITGGGKIHTRTPFSREFVAGAKKLGGRWNADAKTWDFPDTRTADVGKLCADVYGTDPTADAADAPKLVNVRLTARRDLEKRHDGIRFAGRTVARATGRDTGARPGEGAAFISGAEPYSGGSRANWTTCIDEGAVLVLDAIPATMAVSDDDWTCEVVGDAEPPTDTDRPSIGDIRSAATHLAALCAEYGGWDNTAGDRKRHALEVASEILAAARSGQH